MQGKLFVIEGLDGSGKQTQSDILYKNLINDGYEVKKVEYPNYKSESSCLVKMYLRGDFGKDPEKISPYISSTFFAADRYASYKTEYEEFYRQGGIVLADRYTTSNMVHQASKIDDEEEKQRFLKWLWEYEFCLYKLPIPTKVFFLDIPVDISLKLISRRENKFTHTQVLDIHESNENYLRHSYRNALKIAREYDWEIIPCTRNGQLLDINSIAQKVYSCVKKYI